MARRGDPRVLRLLVRFLRDRADLSQTEVGKACRVDQAAISRYETDTPVPEDVLRRMAAVARVEWWFVVALRSLYAAILDQVEPTLSSRAPIALGPMPTSMSNPAPRPRTKVEFPRDPLAITAN